MPVLVDIVLPSGERATVPQADLAQALAAGATRPAADTAPDGGGALGAGAAGVFGAGSTATFGLSDRFLAEGAEFAGGLSSELRGGKFDTGAKAFRKDVTGNIEQVKKANPYATMAGEGAGLFINPAGVTAAGEAVEGAVAARVGEGLAGRIAAYGARGAFEAGGLGAQRQVTEDTLGDHAYNGEAIFAASAKDALLGAGLGAALGAGSYGLSKASGLLRRGTGPASDAVLDEIAGAPGAGRRLEADARAAENLVEDLRKTGATGEQAAKMVDGIEDAARVRSTAAVQADGVVSSAVDDVADAYSRMHGSVDPGVVGGGAGPTRQQLIQTHYANSAAKLTAGEEALERSALKMSDAGTKTLRNLEDTVNEVQFTHKPQQFAKLVDAARSDVQRDTVAALLQDTDGVLSHWEATAAKGGAGRDIGALRKTYADALNSLASIEAAGGPTMSRDLYVKSDNLKRALDRSLKWGRENRFGLPEAIVNAQEGLETLTNKWRAALEDESVWGKAGPAQARWNGSFSQVKARRDHFMGELGVSIDQTAGIRIPEVDFKKARGMLNELRGNDTDAALQAVKSTEAFIAGTRDRVAAIREFGDLTPAQSAKLTAGLKDLDAFEAAFNDARKEAVSVNRLRAAVLEERNAPNVGGLVGLVSDIVTKPLTTIQRLASIKRTVAKTEEGITTGLRKFFGGKGEAVAERIAPRARDAVTKEIDEIRTTAANPAALQARAAKMVGDLGTFAPKIAREVEMTAIRAIDFLAREAPKPSVPIGIIGMHKTKSRYSDQQISDFETKRAAALDPESVVRDMRRGKLNREAIQTVEQVSPKLFAMMQDLALQQIATLEAQGKLDNMPYQQKAVIATLLKVPADATWRPDFIAMMQAAKMTPVQPTGATQPQQANTGTLKRRVDIDTSAFATEAQGIEGGM